MLAVLVNHTKSLSLTHPSHKLTTKSTVLVSTVQYRITILIVCVCACRWLDVECWSIVVCIYRTFPFSSSFLFCFAECHDFVVVVLVLVVDDDVQHCMHVIFTGHSTM